MIFGRDRACQTYLQCFPCRLQLKICSSQVFLLFSPSKRMLRMDFSSCLLLLGSLTLGPNVPCSSFFAVMICMEKMELLMLFQAATVFLQRSMLLPRPRFRGLFPSASSCKTRLDLCFPNFCERSREPSKLDLNFKSCDELSCILKVTVSTCR